MPKLSEDSLKKRFVCQYCGEPIRTRQGLSGHIQWKHATGGVTQHEDINYLSTKANEWVKYGTIIFLSPAEIHDQQNILKNWSNVRLFCKHLHIKLSNTDFKNYLVTAMAQIHTSRQMQDKLFSSVNKLHQEIMELMSD